MTHQNPISSSAQVPPCNCLALRRAARNVTLLYDRALAPLKLRATQYSVLSQLGNLGPLPLNQLAAILVLDRAAVGHNVRPLLARRLVRLTVGRDRRRREVSLTPAGKKLLQAARALWNDAQKCFEKELGARESLDLRSSLHRVATTEFALPASRGVGSRQRKSAL